MTSKTVYGVFRIECDFVKNENNPAKKELCGIADNEEEAKNYLYDVGVKEEYKMMNRIFECSELVLTDITKKITYSIQEVTLVY